MRTLRASLAVVAGCAACTVLPPPPAETPVVDDATLEHRFCERFVECSGVSADYVGDCAIQARNALIRLRNKQTAECDVAATALQDAYACLAEQPCEVVQNNSQWESECDDWRIAREQSDVCEGRPPPPVDEGPQYPCDAAQVFESIEGNQEDVIFERVAGSFDAAPLAACATELSRPTSATVTMDVTGDASLVVAAMSGFDGSSATTVLNLAALDTDTLTATVCAADASMAEVAVQLYIAPSGATRVLCATLTGP